MSICLRHRRRHRRQARTDPRRHPGRASPRQEGLWGQQSEGGRSSVYTHGMKVSVKHRHTHVLDIVNILGLASSFRLRYAVDHCKIIKKLDPTWKRFDLNFKTFRQQHRYNECGAVEPENYSNQSHNSVQFNSLFVLSRIFIIQLQIIVNICKRLSDIVLIHCCFVALISGYLMSSHCLLVGHVVTQCLLYRWTTPT